MDAILVHYHEISLKGKNRPLFIERLVENLRSSVADLGVKRGVVLSGRLLIPLKDEIPWGKAKERLQKVFGVATFSPAFRTAPMMQALKKRVGEEVVKRSFQSFRITARRAEKTFPMTSDQINRDLGTFVKELTQTKVDLTNPELNIFVEVLPREIFFSFEKVQGPGGLPVGISGKVVLLLSGGIDSPVAAWRMMKRGCRVVFVHFHSHPYVSRTSQEKVCELVQLLNHYQHVSRLYLVPFGELQREVVLSVPAPSRVVVYRRLMMRIAARIARDEGAKALITGESLGQVASQTLDNLAVIEEASPLPVLRPLIGMDKEEIIEQARAIATFEISIVPDQDCCQLFIPKHPATRTMLPAIREAEEKLNIEELIEEGLKGVEVRELRR
ncbi:MAG: tRNA 4-thiouridine(8) synthase ThiI [candidate division NC10 bacterium]|nr:tRNA 4-thiouridine(8) synthase ThiI [candidate division NC10 bacterium]